MESLRSQTAGRRKTLRATLRQQRQVRPLHRRHRVFACFPETEITGWNIYRDGNAIQSGHPSTVFTDANASESVHAYNVAAVGRHNGVEIEFPLSVTVKSPKSGAVEDVSTDERNILGRRRNPDSSRMRRPPRGNHKPRRPQSLRHRVSTRKSRETS